jgi:hypothetical protein
MTKAPDSSGAFVIAENTSLALMPLCPIFRRNSGFEMTFYTIVLRRF